MAIFNVVDPGIVNDDIHVVVLFNVVDSDTFNVDMHVVVALFKGVVPDIFQFPEAIILPVISNFDLAIAKTIVLFIGSSQLST